MKKHINWLLKELDLWVQEGLIDDVQAGAIRDRYPTDEQAGTWGRVAFAIAGALLLWELSGRSDRNGLMRLSLEIEIS
jgi:uncharacterized membrane protein